MGISPHLVNCYLIHLIYLSFRLYLSKCYRKPFRISYSLLSPFIHSFNHSFTLCFKTCFHRNLYCVDMVRSFPCVFRVLVDWFKWFVFNIKCSFYSLAILTNANITGALYVSWYLIEIVFFPPNQILKHSCLGWVVSYRIVVSITEILWKHFVVLYAFF